MPVPIYSSLFKQHLSIFVRQHSGLKHVCYKLFFFMKRWLKYLLKRCFNRKKYLKRIAVLIKTKWTDLFEISGIWSLSDCNRTQTQNHLLRKLTPNHLAKLALSWVFVYELRGCGFESRCSHINIPIIFWYFREVFLSVSPEFLSALLAWHTGKKFLQRNKTSLYFVIPHQLKVHWLKVTIY